MQRKCIACAEPLPADWPGYRRYCTGCYFAQRDEKQAATDEAVEERIRRGIEDGISERVWTAYADGFESGKHHASAAEAYAQYWRGYESGFAQGQRSAPAVELDKQMLRLLLQLTHPDKHDGSAASVKAAAFLNGLRERLD